MRMKRRRFLKNSLLGAGALYTGGQAPFPPNEKKAQNGPARKKARLAGRHLSLEYDLNSGRASLFLLDSTPLLLNATAAAVFPHSYALAADSNYGRQESTSVNQDPVIPGKQLASEHRPRRRFCPLF